MNGRDTGERLDDLEGRVHRLETWKRERDANSRREREERELEWSRMLEGAKSFIEKAVKDTTSETVKAAVSEAPGMRDMGALLKLNQEQKALLDEAAKERDMRKARELVAQENEARAAKERADREAEALAAKALREEQTRQEEAKHRRFIRKWVTVGTVLTTALGTLAGIITSILTHH